MSDTAESIEQGEELTDSDTHADPCPTTPSSSTKPAASNQTENSRSQTSTSSCSKSVGAAGTEECESTKTTNFGAPSAASQRRLITDGGVDSSAESGQAIEQAEELTDSDTHANSRQTTSSSTKPAASTQTTNVKSSTMSGEPDRATAQRDIMDIAEENNHSCGVCGDYVRTPADAGVDKEGKFGHTWCLPLLDRDEHDAQTQALRLEKQQEILFNDRARPLTVTGRHRRENTSRTWARRGVGKYHTIIELEGNGTEYHLICTPGSDSGPMLYKESDWDEDRTNRHGVSPKYSRLGERVEEMEVQ